MENLDGIPDVEGLEQVVEDLETEGKTAKETKTETKAEKKDDGELDLAQFGNDPKKLLEGYKHIQAGFTRLSQENKALKEQLSTKPQEPSEPIPPVYEEPEQKAFDEALIEDPEQAITNVVRNVVSQSKIADVLEEENNKNQDEFMERYSYVQMLSRNPQYNRYTKTADGIRYLFKVADKQRMESLKRSTGKVLESILGEPLTEEQTNRLKTLIKGSSTTTTTQQGLDGAYMPDTTSTKTGKKFGSDVDFDAEINKAVEKGDVDATIDAVFKQALT